MEKTILTFDKKSFYLNGEPIHLFSGDVHYFRIHPSDWDKRLDLCVDFGLNAIQIYVPWNGHEPEEGRYCFEGLYDIELFLQKCKEHGLYVLFRPSPYMCSEWDWGGLPYWLLKKGIEPRTNNRRFLNAVRNFYKVLMPKILPFLSTNGGPIIACAVENEYGSYGNDKAYIHASAKMLRDFGIDVTLYATDGDDPFMVDSGEVRGGFHGMNFSGVPGRALPAAEASKKYVKAPFYSGEFWGGRPMLWGETFERCNPADTAQAYQEALDLGCNVNIYMFSGGTNFGFMGGANYFIPGNARKGSPERFTPRMTSYDADAPVHEDGVPGEKYFMLRDIVDKYYGREPRPHIVPEHKVQVPKVKLTKCADFFENLDALTVKNVRSAYPKNFEELGQDYGLVVYTQQLDCEMNSFAVKDPMDRALMFVNGTFAGSFLRDKRVFSDTCEVQNGHIILADGKGKKRFDVICENLGRVNFGRQLRTEHKGIAGITYCEATLNSFCHNRSVPLKDLSPLAWKANTEKTFSHRKPRFLKGSFKAAAGVDAYVDTHGFDHGYIWVNGFNLGRYDCAGPQYSLYIPGGLLKDGDNEIIVLDLSPDTFRKEIRFADGLILEGASEEMK